MRHFLLGIATLLAVSVSSAATVFTPALSYRTQKLVDNTGFFSNVESRYAIADLRLGHLFDDNGLYLGGIAKIESDGYINGDLFGTAYGASVGWVRGAFSAIFSYFLKAERKYNLIGVERKLSQGKGMQLDIAWTPQLTPNFGFGPQLTYSTLKYERFQNGPAAEAANGIDDTVLYPAIGFWYLF